MLAIIATAVLSSLLTALLGYVLYTQKLQPQLEQQLATVQDEFEQRVRKGVLAAGEELLPQLREQVSLGFQDALGKSQAAGLVEGAAGVVNLGAGVLETGLSTILGIKPRKG